MEQYGAYPAIVLTEDQPGVLAILNRLMRDIADQYDLVTVQSGEEALQVFSRRPVVLLITDYHMPGMNGLELTRVVKRVSPATHVVLITVDTAEDVQQAASEAGVEFFLTKPFLLSELQQAVGAALA